MQAALTAATARADLHAVCHLDAALGRAGAAAVRPGVFAGVPFLGKDLGSAAAGLPVDPAGSVALPMVDDSYTLITPDHPGQTLIHIHPDPNELGRVYRADLAICADMAEFAESAALWDDDIVPFDAGEEAHLEWLDWSTPAPRDGVKLDLGPCVAAMRSSDAAIGAQPPGSCLGNEVRR